MPVTLPWVPYHCPYCDEWPARTDCCAGALIEYHGLISDVAWRELISILRAKIQPVKENASCK